MNIIFKSYKSLAFVALLSLLSGCLNLFLFPTKELQVAPSDYGLNYTEHWIDVGDGISLHAWLVGEPAPHASKIIFLHGNAQNISNHLSSVAWLAQYGFQILIFDYRGYGKSQGEPSLGASLGDISKVFDYARSSLHWEGRQTLVYGQSLGASLATYAISKLSINQVCAAVLESGFSSYPRIVRDKLWFLGPFKWPISWFISNRFSPEIAANSISIPVLIVQGAQDSVVEPYHSQIIYQNLKGPKELWLAPQAQHLGIFVNRNMQSKLVSYLQSQIGACQQLASASDTN